MTRTVALAQVSSESLRGLPGFALRSLANLWLDRETLARVVDAALADLHSEWGAARARNRMWLARWIALRGNAALALSLVTCGLGALGVGLPRVATIAVGALFFPFVLFWVLALAIQPDGVVTTVPRGVPIDMWIRRPHVITPPVSVRPVKVVRTEPVRGLPVRGTDAGSRIKNALPPPGSGGHGSIGVIPPELPRGPAIGSPEEIDAIPMVRIPPDYPRSAIERGIEGFVVVRLWIGTRGEVTRSEVPQAHPRGVFDRAALAAVQRWKYRPGESDGQPVGRGPLEVLLDFKLDDAQR